MKYSQAQDLDVLVVGMGPAGATATLALATYGVRVHAVNKHNWLANSPRAHITNQRALEVLRDLGVEPEVTLYATPWSLMGDMVFFANNVAGEEIARLRNWGTGEQRLSDYTTGSPCPLLDIPQLYMEPILIKNAALHGASFAFNTEYLSHVQDGTGVTTQLRDRLTGREITVRSRYLVGADGAQSRIAEHIGLVIEGQMARAATVYVQFKADLTQYVAHRPSILYRVITPTAGFGEIGLGTLRVIRPWCQWIAGWGHDMKTGEPDLGFEAILPKVQAMIGDPKVDIEVEAVSTWYINQAYATAYSSGRVLCAGDAVHRHPASSGLGSNTSIQDAFNLAWKLAYVIQGYADPSLLDTYSDERVPVGQQVVARANQSRKDYGLISECFRAVGEADSVATGLAKLRDTSAVGVEMRERFRKAIELKNTEFNAHGVELNQRYASTAVVTDPDVGDEVWIRDRQLYLQATTRPGAKLPHVWLVNNNGRRVSILDVTGHGKFSLITGIAGCAWVRAAEQLNLPFLRTLTIGEPDIADPYGDWQRAREVHEAGALLVRPDSYVCWRHSGPIWEHDHAGDLLKKALSRVLDRAF